MRHSTFYSILLLAMVFVSCRKPDEYEFVPKANLTFKQDGIEVTTTKTSPGAVYYKSDPNPNITISGNFNASESIIVRITATKCGTFELARSGNLAGYAAEPNHFYLAQAGTVTVTSVTDTRVTGTFQFLASDNNNQDKAITEGAFDLPLTVK